MSFLRRDKSKTGLFSAGQKYYEDPPSPTCELTSSGAFYDPSKSSSFPNSNIFFKNDASGAGAGAGAGGAGGAGDIEYTYHDHLDNEYSPRSSIVSMSHPAPGNLKDNYKGIHANSRGKSVGNIPPLLHPIKPKFKKKSSSLFNKLISSRKDGTEDDEKKKFATSSEASISPPQSLSSSRANSISEEHSQHLQPAPLSLQPSSHQHQRKSNSSTSSCHSKHKIRIASLTDYHPHHPSTVSANSLQMSQPDTLYNFRKGYDFASPSPGTSHKEPSFSSLPSSSPSDKMISLDLNLDEIQDIVKSNETVAPKQNWKAPDSWDVKAPKTEEMISVQSQQQSMRDELSKETATTANTIATTSTSSTTTTALVSVTKTLPSLYGARESLHVVNTVDPTPNHIIRVFKEDGTFTTILCSLEATTCELLAIVQRKFFLESASNYQLTVHIGNSVKVLESFEKPIKIQLGLLLLSGYNDDDNLRIIGRGDLSYVCRFIVENIYLRSLTHEEEVALSKNYVDVNISSLNLKNIPIIFHQHTYEIEKLNVSENPSIYIPLDFIQSCTNLTVIDSSRNGSSKFPINFLEATNLTDLNLEMNFLDELPMNINLLENLTHLKLNSNQLISLPKSFGKLSKLVSLNLSSNYFNQYPEPVNDLQNLIELDLSYNDLYYLPNSIVNLKALQKLNLCTNKLSKVLPKFFSELKSLKRLDIRYNQISNVDVLGQLPALEVLYASRNNISGFCDQMENLKLLHFDKNPITLLQFVNPLQMLNVLDLSKAKITSIPPAFIENISNVEKVVLDNNHLVILPNEIGNLSKLTHLSIYSNNLQSIPVTIGNLFNLQHLDLHSNNIQSLPSEIWNLQSLTILNIASNNLTAFPKPPFAIAKRISSSTNLVDLPTLSRSLADSLSVLTIADNRLNDDCFEPISFLISLTSLNVSYNDLVEIPEGSIVNLVKLRDLYLSGNEISTLPDELVQLKTLKLLYINNNKLITLPAKLSQLKNLSHFDGGSNQLYYNISNFLYDWNWNSNKKLKFLNLSGNKRFHIKDIKHTQNEEMNGFLGLKELKVLGLIDVTLTTTSLPEQSIEKRVRTTGSEIDNIGYGVSDTMGGREFVSNRDLFIQKFRGNEKELLVCSFDGKHGSPNHGHRISAIAKGMFASSFAEELMKVNDEDDKVHIALRRAFLNFNKEINGTLLAKKDNTIMPLPYKSKDFSDLNLTDDARSGAAVTVIYIRDKKLYSANIGDIEALLCQNNGNFKVLTNAHKPTNRQEFERIRAAGGYVSGSGDLDGDLAISRGVGFFSYLPHTHSGPDVNELTLTPADDLLIIGTKVLWDFLTYEFAVDIIRQDKHNPMVAAQKLRDFAISYGASDKITVIVLTFGEKPKQNSLYKNVGREAEFFAKKRRDRQIGGDSALRRLDNEIEPPTGELALVFTDIKNSTLLWDTYPVPMRSAIKTHNSIMRRQLRIIGGYEVKTEGDAFMVAFPSPTSALLWCFNVQQNLLTADWPTEILETDQCCEVTDGKGNIIYRGLSVRMGTHWGSPVCEPDIVTGRMDYFGPMVNRASRVSAIADGGQIAVSSDFLAEMKALTAIHEDIKSNKKTISDAYHGEENAGRVIERELNAIEDHGTNFYKIGERKLKGLETPEMITLVYSSRLKLRFEIFQKRLDVGENHSTRVIGTLPMDCIAAIHEISLRLENLLSFMNGGTYIKEGFKQTQKTRDISVQDLLNAVTRIENSVTTLFIRQRMNKGKVGFNTESLTSVLNELTDTLAKVQ
ncbi:hypothetical protein KGF56_001724 [Candida oxycetoniae]|uniref:Adenylate cyclase n=1 Tax=Candida oxycetoniae TaxID=497107 RepID=A0AAI9SZ77_9ASCO|nr:uncharacterized protein KGF56_001724 [Candida oxycetoniae]KAI3405477.2 hypothetical protein KGF56_001724 [Candida oxycetoniae]